MSRRWLGPLLIVLAFLGTALVYPYLPAEVPTHWNWRGEVDDTMARWPGAFLVPLVLAGVWVLLPVLRRIDPRRRNYERFEETFWVVLNVLAVGMVLLQAVVLAAALALPIPVGRAVLLAVGVLFLLLGNYLPRLRSNWWMGLRTPWTLESEAVWRRTHRLGGRLFVLAGLVCMAGALLLGQELAGAVAFGSAMVAVLVPAIYSYFSFRQERRERS